MKARSLIFVLLAAAAMANAQSLKSAIHKVDGPVCRAMMKKDIKGFEKIVKPAVTPDFKYSEGGPAMGFDEMIAGMKQGFAMYSKITKAQTKLVSVKENGSMGSSVEKHTMVGMMMGPDKKSHKVVFAGTSNSTYKKVNGKWLMATMNMKTDKMTMDGKPMPMPQIGGQGKQ